MPTDSIFSVFLFAFAVSIGPVVSPGPVSAAIISESPRHGWRVGPLMAAAHVGLEAIVVVLIAFGLQSGLASDPLLRFVSIAGGVLLLAIGGQYLLGAIRDSIHLPGPDQRFERRSLANLLGLGAVTTLSNPFWYAWWATVAAGYLAQARGLGLAAVAVFYLGHMSADMAWDSLLAGVTAAGGRWLTPGLYRTLLVVTGGFMCYIGVQFLIAGMTT